MDPKKKKELTELLSGYNADDLEEIAPHIVADIGAQAVEVYKEDHPASETDTKDKPKPKAGTEEKDPKVAELEGKLKKYEEKEAKDEINKLISTEVEKYPKKFQPMAKNLIESNVKVIRAAGEVKDDKKIVAKAVEAADKSFEESELGVVKTDAPASAQTSESENTNPFAHAGYTGNY